MEIDSKEKLRTLMLAHERKYSSGSFRNMLYVTLDQLALISLNAKKLQLGLTAAQHSMVGRLDGTLHDVLASNPTSELFATTLPFLTARRIIRQSLNCL